MDQNERKWEQNSKIISSIMNMTFLKYASNIQNIARFYFIFSV